jgi:uncharacterized membrane protein
MPLVSLVFHVAVGVAALVGGFIAIAARKGGTWHRRSGMVFVYTMIATGLTAAGISVYEGKSPGGGVVTAYFVFTAWTTIRPLPGGGRRVAIGLMVFVFAMAVLGYFGAVTALDKPGNQLNGVPAGMLFFMSTITLLAAFGDFRMMRAGGIQGSRRIARHLWRMCFGLFIATGSFVAQLVMMKYVPDALRSLPVILALSAGPLVMLVYWMWRIRLRQNLRGLMTARPVEAIP